MLLNRKILFTVLLSGFVFSAFAQTGAYLKTRDMLYYGAIHELEKKDPTQVIFEFNNGNKRIFKPGEAIEFGIQEGQLRWIAKTFEGKSYFFLELEGGKSSSARAAARQENKLLPGEERQLDLNGENTFGARLLSRCAANRT